MTLPIASGIACLDLHAVKKALGHGRFTPWIEAEFGMSDQTARNFMNVATRFPKSKSLLDLKFTKEALYLLAAPSTDGEVVEVVMEKAEAGEKIGKAEVDAIKKEFKKEIELEKEKSRNLRVQRDASKSQAYQLNESENELRDTITGLKYELETAQEERDVNVHDVLEMTKFYYDLCSDREQDDFLVWIDSKPEGQGS